MEWEYDDPDIPWIFADYAASTWELPGRDDYDRRTRELAKEGWD